MNSAMNTGKHCLNRVMMLCVLCLRDFGVSSNAKGNVSTKNVAMAPPHCKAGNPQVARYQKE